MPETNLKNGDVSAYGFMCGYVQSAIAGPPVIYKNVFGENAMINRFQVRLFAEGGVFHIHVRDWKLEFGLEAWESFDTLKDARKSYKKAVKFYSELPEDYRVQERGRTYQDDPFTPDWAKV